MRPIREALQVGIFAENNSSRHKMLCLRAIRSGQRVLDLSTCNRYVPPTADGDEKQQARPERGSALQRK